MKIGIIDADLIGRKNHNFPNIACEKISSYYKERNDDVDLLTNYEFDPDNYNKIYISKVFTDTSVPEWVTKIDGVNIGGTGFYFDKAPNLPDEIEHHMPDYHLYDTWIESQINNAMETAKKSGKEFKENRFLNKYKEYTDYSIGFLTRGCFRKCDFCVNRKYDHVFQQAVLNEFYDPTRKKICLLDDNFFGYKDWETLFDLIIQTNKRFKFKQGMDARILNDRKCEKLFSAKYDGDYTFAFDNIKDYELIERKLELIRSYTQRRLMFYVFCGFDRTNCWDNFWYQDIIDVFKRIELLMKYGRLPYIMRFNRYIESPFRGMYVTLARWCNQPNMFKRKSFEEYCMMESRSQKYLQDFISNTNIKSDYPHFLTMRFGN